MSRADNGGEEGRWEREERKGKERRWVDRENEERRNENGQSQMEVEMRRKTHNTES